MLYLVFFKFCSVFAALFDLPLISETEYVSATSLNLNSGICSVKIDYVFPNESHFTFNVSMFISISETFSLPLAENVFINSEHNGSTVIGLPSETNLRQLISILSDVDNDFALHSTFPWKFVVSYETFDNSFVLFSRGRLEVLFTDPFIVRNKANTFDEEFRLFPTPLAKLVDVGYPVEEPVLNPGANASLAFVEVPVCDCLELTEIGRYIRDTFFVSSQKKVKLLSTPISKRRTVFCAVYTMKIRHETVIKAIIKTWGHKCDGLVIYSTEADDEYSAVKLVHEGEESYKTLWFKVKNVWLHIYSHYLNEFDYFFICGDDTFVIVENLKLLLMREDIENIRQSGTGVYLGRPVHVPLNFFKSYIGDELVMLGTDELCSMDIWKNISKSRDARRLNSLVYKCPSFIPFHSGGSGYVLDKVAVKILVENIQSLHCLPNHREPAEDYAVAHCLLYSNPSIAPYVVTDELGRYLFHPMSPEFLYEYKPSSANFERDWYNSYHIPAYNPIKLQTECCGSDSVSFHYIRTVEDMWRLYHAVYSCKEYSNNS